MKIYYLHGFRSAGTSTAKAELFADYYEKKSGRKAKIINVKYEPHDSTSSINLFDEMFKDIESRDDAIVVGTSLGGFWALFVSIVYGIPCYLINPSLRPAERLTVALYDKFDSNEKIEVTSESITHFKTLAAYIKHNHYKAAAVVMLAKDDEVIDYSIAAEMLSNHEIYIVPKAGHRFDINILRKLIKVFVGKNMFSMTD